MAGTFEFVGTLQERSPNEEKRAMIAPRKLARLPRESRLHKIALLLQRYELDLRSSRSIDLDYLAAIVRLLSTDDQLPERVRLGLGGPSLPAAAGELLRRCNELRHALLAHLGAAPAEWDLLCPATGELDPGGGIRLPMRVYLDSVRSPFNIGALLRSAEAFGVERVYLSPSSPLPSHPRARRASMGSAEVVPWEIAEPEVLSGEPGLFALETGGAPLEEFAFPPSGTVIVGSEELGVSPELLRRADAALGRVSIPLLGSKRSLNVAAAFTVLVYRWASFLTKAR